MSVQTETEAYPRPDNEQARLQRLHELGILDTATDPDFEDVVDMARSVFDVPIVLITLVDENRQWFKASRGLKIRETPREPAFCNHVILTGNVFVVEDAAHDPRFENNPFVVSGPHIRFYAGAPLHMGDGLMAGSLCIIDTVPRTLDASQEQQLQHLAAITSSLLRQNRNAMAINELSRDVVEKSRLIERQSVDLRVQKRILDCASDLAQMGAWELNCATGEFVWSDGMYALHEVGRDYEVSRRGLRDFYSPEEYQRLQAAVAISNENKAPYTFEGEMTTAKGNHRWVKVVGDVELVDGVMVRRFGMKLDITAEKEALEGIKHLAERDTLTGLHNRSSLLRRLDDIRDSDANVALLMLDLDGFKDINDTHGHAAGDICLQHVAKRLEEMETEGRFIARIGGDEFAIILESFVHIDDVLALGRAINELTTQPVNWHGLSFRFSGSIGISTRLRADPLNATNLLSEADLALYRSKSMGRNCAAVFEPEMRVRSEQRVAVIAAIRNALSNRELELYYQAKVPLASSKPGGFEALLRWNHPDGRILTPDGFRAALEDPQLSVAIDDFVISEVLDQAARWQNRQMPFGTIAINIGGQRFRDADLAARIIEGISRRHLDPHLIEVEVTEDVFLSRSSQTVLQTCQELRDFGVGVSFDDFGTGFASLTHLLEFPVSAIKIDRSFVSRLSTRAGTTGVIRAICELGNSLGIDVVAEGVETQEQADFLKSIGCDFAQGYLFHRPAPASQIEALGFAATANRRA